MVAFAKARPVRLVSGLLVTALVLVLAGGIAQAQDYGFSMDRNWVQVYIQEDSS